LAGSVVLILQLQITRPPEPILYKLLVRFDNIAAFHGASCNPALLLLLPEAQGEGSRGRGAFRLGELSERGVHRGVGASVRKQGTGLRQDACDAVSRGRGWRLHVLILLLFGCTRAAVPLIHTPLSGTTTYEQSRLILPHYRSVTGKRDGYEWD
jgi:hypothetical protein